MTASRTQIVQFCEDYLAVKDFDDHCVNGLQVEGADQVKKIVTGVSLSQQLIQAAIRKNAQMILVHHGLFESQLKKPPRIIGYMKARLQLLLRHDLNLAGFHLPLDAHPQIGNNISLCRLLGATKRLRKYDIGFIGNLARPLPFPEFVKLVNKKLGVTSHAVNGGPKTVRTVAVVSGGASPWFEGAIETGADTFLTGEIKESIPALASELHANFVAAGHYNTEKLGIQNLGKLLARKFKVQAEFVDIPCKF